VVCRSAQTTDHSRYTSNGKRQAKKNFTVSGNINGVNELAVLKLQCMTILSTQERKYETKTFNENFAKKVRTCRLPFPET
jgi:hypothetical protein